MSLKLFLLLAAVTVALLAAGNSPNHVKPMYRSGASLGERVQISPGTSFQTLSSSCGKDNSGNIAIGPKTNNSNYVAGSSAPFVNVQAAQAEVISNGYRVTWFVESIPNQVQVCGDYDGSGYWSYDLEYVAYVYNEQNCLFDGSSMIAIQMSHRYTYGVSCTLQNKTLQQALEDDFGVNYLTANSDGSYSFWMISSTKTITINPSTNTITIEVNAPTLNIPDDTEAAEYSVFFNTYYNAGSLPSQFSDVCNIVGSETPKTCSYPDPFSPSSSPKQRSASSTASKGGGMFS